MFKPWAPAAKEIIVDPATVSSLLAQIIKLEAGDLAEIRERNQRRDAREQQQERVVCQVISMAA